MGSARKPGSITQNSLQLNATDEAREDGQDVCKVVLVIKSHDSLSTVLYLSVWIIFKNNW